MFCPGGKQLVLDSLAAASPGRPGGGPGLPVHGGRAPSIAWLGGRERLSDQTNVFSFPCGCYSAVGHIIQHVFVCEAKLISHNQLFGRIDKT